MLEKSDHMLTAVGVALKQKPLEDGLTREEASDLFDMLSGPEGIPIDISGQNACAMGFVNQTDADLIDFDFQPLKDAVMEILNNKNNESRTGFYVMRTKRVDLDIYIGY